MPWKQDSWKQDWYPGDVGEITQNCEIGSYSERAVVLTVDPTTSHPTMTIVFPGRVLGSRVVNTGTDYLYIRKV